MGDRYQRGGGNLAKAVAEQAGLRSAPPASTSRASAAGPCTRSPWPAAWWPRASSSASRWSAGCSLAKLGMKYQGHLRHGQPILEDTLVGVALLVERDDGRSPRLRLDAVGRHTVAAGSSQKAIFEALVRGAARARSARASRDVDKYATELHNPELTEPSGSGDVPLLNYRVIGGPRRAPRGDRARRRRRLRAAPRDARASRRPRATSPPPSPSSATPSTGSRRAAAARALPRQGQPLPRAHDPDGRRDVGDRRAQRP